MAFIIQFHRAQFTMVINQSPSRAIYDSSTSFAATCWWHWELPVWSLAMVGQLLGVISVSCQNVNSMTTTRWSIHGSNTCCEFCSQAKIKSQRVWRASTPTLLVKWPFANTHTDSVRFSLKQISRIHPVSHTPACVINCYFEFKLTSEVSVGVISIVSLKSWIIS